MGSIITTLQESVSGPLDIILLIILFILIYKLFLSNLFRHAEPKVEPTPQLPPLKRQDLTVEQLRQYDGVRNAEGRVCIGVDGKIFDVTRAKSLYGPDGPYGIFAGHDASRGLATFSTSEDAVRETYDDLSDLQPSEIDSMREWAVQFREKYPVIGRLLKPGEQPDIYSDEDDTISQSSSVDNAGGAAAASAHNTKN